MKTQLTKITIVATLAIALAFTVSCNNEKKCGDEKYNPKIKFCTNYGGIQDLCGSNKYDIVTQFCYEENVVDKCSGNEYNPSTQFCHDNNIFKKCNGKEFVPKKQFCAEDGSIKLSCADFDSNMEIEHHGKMKKQICDNRDDKKYAYVKIGTQIWMAENLNYNAESSKCHDNSLANCDKYGRLYDWETAKKVCPDGWHLPSDMEWGILIKNINEDSAGYKLKTTYDWEDSRGRSTNGGDDYGFSALPAGTFNDRRGFSLAGEYGAWWAATGSELDAKHGIDYYIHIGININKSDSRGLTLSLISVRCLQDCISCKSKCDETEIFSEYQFCFANKVYDKCYYKNYNPSTQFCVCRYDGASPSSSDCHIMELCDSNEFKDYQFCFKGEIYDKCDYQVYNPKTQSCCGINDGSAAVYDIKTEFCGGDIFSGYGAVYNKCEGKEYNYETHFCEDNRIQEYKCSDRKYNFAKKFCHENKIYDRCFSGDVFDEGEYNPETQRCKDGEIVGK
jgi:uncharacterized protein (TIGR02145 family)